MNKGVCSCPSLDYTSEQRCLLLSKPRLHLWTKVFVAVQAYCYKCVIITSDYFRESCTQTGTTQAGERPTYVRARARVRVWMCVCVCACVRARCVLCPNITSVVSSGLINIHSLSWTQLNVNELCALQDRVRVNWWFAVFHWIRSEYTWKKNITG